MNLQTRKLNLITWIAFAIENLKDVFDYYSDKATNKVVHKIKKQIA